MFDNLFENRDKTVTNLIKLGDCLGRSLRENICIFTIDSTNNQVNFLTESGKVISGTYAIGKDVSISNITVQDAEVFNNGEVFDSFVKDRISSLVESIYYNEYVKAEDSFDEVLSLWKNRLKINSLQNKLLEKRERLSAIEEIIETDEFARLLEITPQLKEFLESNFDKIKNIAEIRNAVNLSNTVAQAFNFPRLDYDTLVEGKSYRLVDNNSNSIYEMICRQELIKKELLESKRDFDTIWATNDKVIALANTIFESDEVVLNALFEAIKEVPYLALVSKGVLTNTINNCLAKVEGIGINESDIQEHASKIFEIKKEAKKLFINAVNEKYGVDIQNLKEPPTFKSLVNTQVVIFESLARLAPKGSVLKKVLSEVSYCLKNKSGVQAIDVNEYIFELFNESGYSDILSEAVAQSAEGGKKNMNLKRIVKNLDSAQSLLGNIKKRVETSAGQMDSEESIDQAELEGELEAAPAKPAAKKGKAAPKQKEMPPEESPEEPGEIAPEAGIPSKKEDAAALADKGAVAPNPQDQQRTLEDLTDLENMLADLAAEIGIPDAGEQEAPAIEKPTKAKPKAKKEAPKPNKMPDQEVD